jgi:hypothetical protein
MQQSEQAEVWCVLELMGHVRTAGRLTEEELFGAKLGRLDVPQPDGTFVTQHFGGGSVYRITYVSEEAARQVAARTPPAPVHSWEMPRVLPAATTPTGEQVFSQDEDDDDRPF